MLHCCDSLFRRDQVSASGLIRAYAHPVSTHYKEIGIVEGTLQQELSIHIAYPQLGKNRKLLGTPAGECEKKSAIQKKSSLFA